MNKSPDTQAWKLGAIAIVLAVVLPTLLEYGLTTTQVAAGVA